MTNELLPTLDPEVRKLALENLLRPVKYDRHGQWITDRNSNRVLDIRGWGRIQYIDYPRPPDIQDAIGELICHLINTAGEP